MVLKLILQASLGISHITNGEIIINDKKYVQMQERRSHSYMSRYSIVRSNSFFFNLLVLDGISFPFISSIVLTPPSPINIVFKREI